MRNSGGRRFIPLGAGEDQEALEQAVILGGHEAGEARVLDVVVGEQHRDLPGHPDLGAAGLAALRSAVRVTVTACR